MRRPVFGRSFIGFPFFRYWVTIRDLNVDPLLFSERHRINFRPLLTIGDRWMVAVSWASVSFNPLSLVIRLEHIQPQQGVRNGQN